MYTNGSLSALLTSEPNRRITLGMSDAEVYHLPVAGSYLKVAKHRGFSDLRRERRVLEWLDGRFPAPRVLGYEETSTHTYMLATEIAGTPASATLSAATSTSSSEKHLAGKLAHELRRLHDLPIEGCTLDQRLDVKFENARRNISLKLLSQTEEDFANEHDGKLPIDLLHELSARRPVEDDLVFTHGDPCMPNLLTDDGEVTGFVDLGGAGVADRYADIAIFFRSFKNNCREPIELETVFCAAYGIEHIDHEKFEFYLLLDDLF